MKKIITLISVAFMALFISCGPSAEEKAKIEEQRLDSLNAVMEQQRQDSIAAAEKIAQEAMAAAQQATADSLRMVAEADSIAAAAKLKSKVKKIVKPVIKKATEWKAGQGKG